MPPDCNLVGAARAIGLATEKAPDAVAAESLVAWLDQLNADLEVPRLRECCGGDVERFRATLAKMAADALEWGSPQNNPVVPAAGQIIELFELAW